MRVLVLLISLLTVAPGSARAEGLLPNGSWEGPIDYFVTGASLAVDGPDADTDRVDVVRQPASVTISDAEIPASARILAASLYWAGTIADQDDCQAPLDATDALVSLTLPGEAAPTTVFAQHCACAAGAGSYDVQACRSDITDRAEATGMLGTFTVGDFSARIGNGFTDNASFSLVFVYEDASLPVRRVALFDGAEEFHEGARTLSLGGLDVDSPAQGDLAWYVLDGDLEGGEGEYVEVVGQPGGGSLRLSDALNPVDDPMNQTINTTVPTQSATIGVDLDLLDISAALTPGDVSVEMTYSASQDKYWVVYNIVGINVFKPVFHLKQSTNRWTLTDDADGSGTPSVGDTLRFDIHLVNIGSAPGVVTLSDDIGDEASSWSLLSAGGGVDASTEHQLRVVDLPVPALGVADVAFELVLSPESFGRTITNIAVVDAGPDSAPLNLAAPPLRVDGDGDDGSADVVDSLADVGAQGDAVGSFDASDAVLDLEGGDTDARSGGELRPSRPGADGGCGGCRGGGGGRLGGVLLLGTVLLWRRFRSRSGVRRAG